MNIQILSALIGMFGVVVGIILNEYFIQRNKQSLFSAKIYSKKFEVYLELLSIFQLSCKHVREAVSNDKLSDFKRETIVRNDIVTLIDYTDSNILFIDQKITLKIIETLLLVDLKKNKFKKNEIVFSQNYSYVVESIKDDLGITRVNNFLDSLNRKRSILKYSKFNSLFNKKS